VIFNHTKVALLSNLEIMTKVSKSKKVVNTSLGVLRANVSKYIKAYSKEDCATQLNMSAKAVKV